MHRLVALASVAQPRACCSTCPAGLGQRNCSTLKPRRPPLDARFCERRHHRRHRARLSRSVAGEHDPMRSGAREVTAPLKLPLMVHVGQSVTDASDRRPVRTRRHRHPHTRRQTAFSTPAAACCLKSSKRVTRHVSTSMGGAAAWDVVDGDGAGLPPDTIS